MENATGIVRLPSKHSAAETLDRLEAILREKGIQIFARIDHAGEAKRAGLELRPTEVLIFGNPLGGTPLMAARPEMAIDLPLKALVWRDEAGQVWIGYNSPEYLRDRFHAPPELFANIAGVGKLIEQAAA